MCDEISEDKTKNQNQKPEIVNPNELIFKSVNNSVEKHSTRPKIKSVSKFFLRLFEFRWK